MIGRTGHFTLESYDADAISRRRVHAEDNLPEHRSCACQPVGCHELHPRTYSSQHQRRRLLLDSPDRTMWTL